MVRGRGYARPRLIDARRDLRKPEGRRHRRPRGGGSAAGCVLSGLSADTMARIARMSLPAVEAELAELERAGDAASGASSM